MKTPWTLLTNGAFFAFAALLFASCSDPLTPVMPVWDVNLNVPFSARSYTITDLIAQDTTVKATNAGGSSLKATVKDGRIVDTCSIHLSENNLRELLKVNNGILVCELENRLPAGVTIDAEFLDGSLRTLIAPEPVDAQAFQISPANIDADGRATSTVTTRTEIALTGTDLKALAGSAFVRLHLNVNTPGTRTVTFAAEDFIKIRMFASLIVRSDLSNP